jgi:hypothetical protein
MARAEPIAASEISVLTDDRVEPMKTIIAFGLLFAIGAVALIALGAAAQAKLAPVEPQPTAISPDNLAMSAGAAAATFEQDYFRAPEPASAAERGLPCRLQLRIFDKTRLAQWCR